MVEKKDRKGCVCASDQNWNICMIDSAPDRLRTSAPCDPVVEGAAGKEDHSGQGEDSQGNSAAQAVSDGNERQASDQAERAHDEVDNPAQFRGKCRNFRLAGLMWPLGGRIHGLTIAQEGRKSDLRWPFSPSACRWKGEG